MNNIAQAVNNMKFREKNGKLEGRLCYQGTRKSFYGSSKTECKTKARKFLAEIDKYKSTSEKITLNEYMQNWLDVYKKTTVEPSTYARMVSVYENQIKDSIGKKQLSDITTDDIQNLINSHALGTGGKKPLAKSGLKKLQHLLSPCFAHAVKNEIISKNPCDNVIIPSESNIVVKTKEQFALSDEEIKKFKEAGLVRNKNGQIKYRDGIALVFMVGTGLRIGELVALKWDDIHMEENYIHIHSTVQTGLLGEEKTRIKDGTKTSSERMLPLNDNIKEYINMLKEWYEQRGIKSEYFVSTEAGTIQNERNLSRSLSLLVKRAGLPKNITPHTLRHTFGSSLIRAGIGVEVVSRLMGHANIMVTYNKYIHVIKEQEAKAMKLHMVI